MFNKEASILPDSSGALREIDQILNVGIGSDLKKAARIGLLSLTLAGCAPKAVPENVHPTETPTSQPTIIYVRETPTSVPTFTPEATKTPEILQIKGVELTNEYLINGFKNIGGGEVVLKDGKNEIIDNLYKYTAATFSKKEIHTDIPVEGIEIVAAFGGWIGAEDELFSLEGIPALKDFNILRLTDNAKTPTKIFGSPQEFEMFKGAHYEVIGNYATASGSYSVIAVDKSYGVGEIPLMQMVILPQKANPEHPASSLEELIASKGGTFKDGKITLPGKFSWEVNKITGTELIQALEKEAGFYWMPGKNRAVPYPENISFNDVKVEGDNLILFKNNEAVAQAIFNKDQNEYLWIMVEKPTPTPKPTETPKPIQVATATPKSAEAPSPTAVPAEKPIIDQKEYLIKEQITEVYSQPNQSSLLKGDRILSGRSFKILDKQNGFIQIKISVENGATLWIKEGGEGTLYIPAGTTPEKSKSCALGSETISTEIDRYKFNSISKLTEASASAFSGSDQRFLGGKDKVFYGTGKILSIDIKNNKIKVETNSGIFDFEISSQTNIGLFDRKIWGYLQSDICKLEVGALAKVYVESLTDNSHLTGIWQ